MTLWVGRSGEVYRDLRALLEERSPHADREEREKLDDVRRIVANMEADLAETMDELEDLRGEAVFDPDQYVQRFGYAGKQIVIVNQSARLIVDMADADYLGKPYDVTLDDLERAYRVLSTDISCRHGQPYRDAVDTVMRREYFGPSTNPDGETTERHLDAALTEAGYTHAYLYGDAEARLDDVLELARQPLGERPTERDGYTVRTGERRTQKRHIDRSTGY